MTFWLCRKPAWKKAKVNFKTYEVTNNYYTYCPISQEIIWSVIIIYNMRNIFLKKSYTKCGKETSPWAFSKKVKIENISGSTIWTFIQFALLFVIAEDYQNILKQRCWLLTFTSYKKLLKKQRDLSGTNLPASFSAWFFRIFHVIFY